MIEHLKLSTPSKDKLRRVMAVSALSFSIINPLDAPVSHADTVSALAPITFDLQASSNSDRDAYIGAEYIIDADSAEGFNVINNTVPTDYANAMHHAAMNPFVQLAIKSGDIDTIRAVPSVFENNPVTHQPYPEAYDAAMFERNESGVNQITLSLSDGRGDPTQRLFTDSDTLEMVIVHESIHATNYEWWDDIYNNKEVGPAATSAIDTLKQACLPIGTWTYAEALKSYGAEPSDFDKSPDLAICKPGMSDVNSALAEEIYRCVDEGHMIQKMRELDHQFPMGHGYDNAYELASSVMTTLIFDPSYIQQCFESQNPNEATMLKKYVKAVLEISFAYRSDLETLLRHNELSSEAIDYILDGDK